MVTDEQVKRLWQVLSSGKSLAQSADRSNMDEKTARKYRRLGRLPSEVAQRRSWRTRQDSFVEVWPEVHAQLQEAPGLEHGLHQWVRHRLRCYLWVQWRTPRRRRTRLGVLGVKPGLAAYISWSRGPWRPSGSKTLNFAIRNAYFDDLGLPRLYARHA